jgi:serine/threonine protein kinase
MAETARGTLEIGVLVANTYAIEGLLGRGGMGAVWLASHVRLPGKKVAIKVLHPDVADEESMARFRREAEIASRLGHPNIVAVHDFNELADGTPYLVLEYLTGESLAARITRGRMTLNQIVPIVRQIGSALQAAHAEHIVHRDLKPANIFLVPTETGGDVGEQAKVLDFGISKIRGSQTVKTQDSAILGTPQYMAPEQALGNHDAVDQRTDVFALGAMVYEMFAGQPAFRGASIPEVVFKVVYEDPPPLQTLVPGLPDDVVAAVHRALAKKPDDRFPDVSAFVGAITGTPLTTTRRGVLAPVAPAVHDAMASTEASTGGRRGNVSAVAGAAPPSPQLDRAVAGDALRARWPRAIIEPRCRRSARPAAAATSPTRGPATRWR